MNGIVWQIDLTALLKKQVRVETRTGHIASGKLTNFHFDKLVIDGLEVEVPVGVELDGDALGAIPLRDVVSIFKA